MDEFPTVKTIIDTQVSYTEALVYVQIEHHDMSAQDVAKVYGVSHDTISRIYNSAKSKMDKQAAGGLFQTELK